MSNSYISIIDKQIHMLNLLDYAILIDNQPPKDNLSIKQNLERIYYNIQAENYNETLGIIENLDLSLNSENYFEAKILQFLVYARLRVFNKIDFDLVENCVLNEFDPFIELMSRVIKANYFLHQDRFEDAQNHFLSLLSRDEINRYPFLEGYARHQLATCLNLQKEYESSLEQYILALNKFEMLQNKLQTISVLNNLGQLLHDSGDYNKSIEYLSQALIQNESTNRDSISAVITMNLGLSYRKLGTLDKAEIYYKKALTLFEKHSLENYNALCQNNLGALYDIKGLMDESEHYYLKSLDTYIKIGDKNGQIRVLSNLGLLYLRLMQYDNAELKLKMALELAEELRRQYSINLINSTFVELYLKTDNREKAFHYLCKYDPNEVDDFRLRNVWELKRASYFLTSRRTLEKAKGIEMLKDLLEKGIADAEVYSEAIIKYCNYLIDEYKNSGAEDIIEEIDYYLSKLNSLGLEQNSILVLIQSLVLKAEFYIFQDNFRDGLNLLNKAIKIAKEYSLNSYAIFISKKQEEFFEMMSSVEENVNRYADYMENIGKINFEELIKNMVTANLQEQDLTEEEPAMLLILSEGGVSIFSYSFAENYSQIGDQLLAGYISAISTAFQEAFKQKGMIERLKHQDHSILSKPLDKYIVCYIYKGISYFAEDKIDHFIQRIQKLDIYNEMLHNFRIGKVDKSVYHNLIKLINACFLRNQEPNS